MIPYVLAIYTGKAGKLDSKRWGMDRDKRTRMLKLKYKLWHTTSNLHSRVPENVGSSSCKLGCIIYLNISCPVEILRDLTRTFHLISLQCIVNCNNITSTKLANTSIQKMTSNSILQQVVLDGVLCYLLKDLNCSLISGWQILNVKLILLQGKKFSYSYIWSNYNLEVEH